VRLRWRRQTNLKNVLRDTPSDRLGNDAVRGEEYAHFRSAGTIVHPLIQLDAKKL
jgi:hypothetical protein